jgi:NAD(P)-dependent dehydrogenase (short-subunit alcohol dehydrogenase family)
MDQTYLILGGGGMIGLQIAREIARKLQPKTIVIASLYPPEVSGAIEQLNAEFPAIDFKGFAGDVFLRTEWNQAGESRRHLMETEANRQALFEDVFGDFDAAYKRSQLAQLILDHKPDVVVDSINTATAISYQDVYSSSKITRKQFDNLMDRIEVGNAGDILSAGNVAKKMMESLLIEQSVPQLVRHVFIVQRAMTEVHSRLYIKVGTTGTGGMGLNIPYTHSEDKPSATLMTKTAIAFAHTGLMFLMARTPDGPLVKEVKPGAMVGYADVTRRTIKAKDGKAMSVFASKTEALSQSLILKDTEGQYQRLGDLEMAIVDTGENGLFAKGEFEAITHLWQMEFVTPEEIAQQVVMEIRGGNTGYDMIGAIDAAVMNPTYRGGYLRNIALQEVTKLEDADHPSVAIGRLGPPELGKLLWEAQLLKTKYGSISAVLKKSADELATEIFELIRSDAGTNLRQRIISIGLPILTPDGASLIRGPHIRIPEVAGTDHIALNDGDVDKYAAKGWVDLRAKNFAVWLDRFKEMKHEVEQERGRGSAAITLKTYWSDDISIGAVAGWIFNNEEGGFRIK